MRNLDKQIKKEMIRYCRWVLDKLDKDYLKENSVNQNEFLEFLYITCLENWESKGEYVLSEELIGMLFSFKKNNEKYMKLIKENKITIKGIDKNDNLIIIDENEIIDRTEVEGDKN